MAAANAGLGIEMDVRPAGDGTPVCFHDKTLDRMTAVSGPVSANSAADLQATKLMGGGHIPLFSELLEIWPHDLPILVEMKIDGATDPAEFAKSVASMVDQFSGKAAMMSFHEAAVEAIPGTIMQGQLIGARSAMGCDEFEAKLKRAVNSPVDYIALNIDDAVVGCDLPKPVVCWTVKQEKQRAILQDLGIAEIFEHLPIPLAADR